MQIQKFKLKPYQRDFIFSHAKFPAMISAWGTGKDLSSIIRSIIFSKESEDNLGLILRKEYKDLADSTVKDFESYTGIKVNSSGDAIIPTDGKPSVIMFRHIEQLNSLQNLNLGWFWINQGEELDSVEPFYLLSGRLRRNTKRRSGWVTANAGGHNWCWQQWVENQGKDKDFPVWQATTYDNEDVLPADYVASLKKLPDSIYKRFVKNDHSVAQGLVWPEFNEELHTCDSFEIPDVWKETFALDHGHNHPTAVLFGAVNYEGKLIIYDEHFESGKLISYHAKRIKEIEPYFEEMDTFIDPTCKFRNMQDGGRIYSVIEAYADHGIYFFPAPMDASAGINKVGELFKNNEIVIFRDKCPNLIREIESWKWKKQRLGQENKLKEEPVRIDEDACKALTYLVASRLEAPEQPKPSLLLPGQYNEKTLERMEEQQSGWHENYVELCD